MTMTMAQNKYARKCDNCGAGMNEGYVIEGGVNYYCSDDCLHNNMSQSQYDASHDDGDGDSFWTDWEVESDNILQAHGFDIEQGGGGCLILSQYIYNGGFVWATCLDGGGLPDNDNWMVCAYGDDIDNIIYELRSDENESGVSLEQAVVAALAVASDYMPPCTSGHRDSGRGVCVDCGGFI